MSKLVKCNRCHQPYPDNQTPHICSCGGIYDFEEFPLYQAEKIQRHVRGMWKYSAMFGLPDEAPVITLGEGDTPMIEGKVKNHTVFYKMESQNPTGSFKDRGTAVLVSFLLSRDIREAVEDSSGNAGASFSAYAAKVGMKAVIYAPESTSGPKRTQIEMYGAELKRIPGPRAEAAKAVLEAVARGCVYASHAYMPFGVAGYASMAYEIYEYFGGAPGTIIVPAGHGGALYGLMLGFESLLHAGQITRLPYFIGVQAENCSPMVSAFQMKSIQNVPVKIQPTLAEGASVSSPIHSTAILRRMYDGNGRMLAASESMIKEAYQLLARQGIYCEPTSSLSITPLLNDKIDIIGPVVSIITGSGYKTNLIL